MQGALVMNLFKLFCDCRKGFYMSFTTWKWVSDLFYISNASVIYLLPLLNLM